MSDGEDVFEQTLLCRPIIRREWEREFRFAPPRKWRFDFAWPKIRLAVEVEGATWAQGRHTRGSGFESDLEKYNTAALMGWTVLRFTTKQAKSGEAADFVERFWKP